MAKFKFWGGLIFLCLTFSVGLLSYIIYSGNRKVSVEAALGNHPWVKPIPYLPPLEGVGEVRAENCGKCHTEIYREWKTSTHANAFTDLQFQSELSKSSSPSWICLNCHIPVSNQRETIVNFLSDGDYRRPIEEANPNFDAKMKSEGVTCATCHIRSDDKGNSYVLGATGGTSPPHPVRIERDLLRNRCLDCHNVSYTLDDQLVCAFNTGNESDDPGNSYGKKTCGTCHMPEIERKFVKSNLGSPKRASHKHAFIGGGVPKRFELYAAQVTHGYESGLKIDPIKWKIAKNSIKTTLEFSNFRSSHYIPSGDPERFLKLIISVQNDSGIEIQRKEAKIGQEWEWYPKAKLISDNRIRPGETRTWHETLRPETKGILVLEIFHVRLKESNAAHMRMIADKASKEYADKIRNIEKFYPFSTLVHKEEVDLTTGKSRIFSKKDLFKISAGRKGE
ncbi:cytochrome c554 and C-prime [Leptospira fainei serovar Hurstbridge str. BUT 6]|uniref:Cytochrome c554 and C-prime n=1 Tax=Leptospira fainei serovar Hurstbridge str. BUT 6 TaxID=1193011 RepID=S3W8U9_9LEPT|nr:multiheme c-type cytochrome [Leptospira fainei]EPG76452.1 cytochrome c554 and C-prime [Leptospira fainei serovar Hurstbridge str. BUT 6]